jgi:excisionase family DNA binding protein
MTQATALTRTTPAGAVDFYTAREAARILRIGLAQLYAAIAAGEIRAIRIGGQFRIPDGEIARLRRGELAAQ